MTTDSEPKRKRKLRRDPAVPEAPYRQTSYTRYDIANTASHVIESYREDMALSGDDPIQQAEYQHNIEGVLELLNRLDHGATGLERLTSDITHSRRSKRRDQE